MRRLLLVFVLLPLQGACAAHRFTAAESVVSAAPAATGTLRAGFARADITPPPGPGLMGYGPEGKAARGWRHRLHARALVLEDADGERVALVTLDLGQLSPLLHRAVAARVRSTTGIGADRLVLAATHTHAAPGHHFGHPSYDEFGTSVSGFDPALVEFLAERIAAAVLEAHSARAEARAAWGTRALWELTANRSIEPFERNPAEWRGRFPKPPGSTASGHVDSTLAVLRIDVRDADGAFRPAGAFSVFAIHGTGNPSPNELIDGDIHAIAARRVELYIDSINGRAPAFAPRAVSLLANGAEGDVSPDLALNTRCQVPTLQRLRRPAGPRTPPGPELWVRPDPDSQAACLSRARTGIEFIGTSLGDAIIAVHDSLAPHLTAQLRVRRVFESADIVATQRDGIALCPAQPGTATLGGADDGRTRYADWRILGLIDVGFKEDSAHTTRPRATGCQGVKRPFLGRLQRRSTVRLLPHVAQLTLVGVGDVLLVALPFEVTTVAGGRLRDAALLGAPRFREAIIVGLANGYNQYLATAEEYGLQHYEGASTLYGPRTADYFAAWTRALAERMPAAAAPSPPAELPPVEFVRIGRSSRLPGRETGPAADAVDPRALDAAWRGDTLIIRWTDVHPGRLVPADGAVIEIRHGDGAGGSVRTWDDDRDVEVWALGSLGRRGYSWEARWSPPEPPAGGVEVVLLERPGLRERSVLVPAR